MANILTSIIEFIHDWVGSYGWTIILFTLLIKLLLFPLDYKSRKSMKQMERLQPQLLELQNKYANDKEKLAQKTTELYQRSGMNPMAGCLPTLFSMVILFTMFSAMRNVSNMQMAQQTLHYLADGTFAQESFLWIKNLWMPDSPFAAAVPTAKQLSMIPAESWAHAYAALTADQLLSLPTQISFDFSSDACAATIESICAYLNTQSSYITAIQTIPQFTNINLLITKLSMYAHANGWFILPLLSCVTQILMTRITQGKAMQTQNTQTQAMQTNRIMLWIMPLFSLYICLDYSASFALYWVASNCFAILQTLLLNHLLSREHSAQ